MTPGHPVDPLHFVVRRLPVPLARAFAANDSPQQAHRETLKALQRSCMLHSDEVWLRQACQADYAPGQPNPVTHATAQVHARTEIRQDLIACAFLIAPLQRLPRLTGAHAGSWPPSRLAQALDAAALR